MRHSEWTRTSTFVAPVDVALDERDVLLAGQRLAVGDRLEVAVVGRQAHGDDALDELLGAAAGTRSGRRPSRASSPWRSQNRTRSGTRAIVPSSFIISQTTPGRREAGEPREVDRGLGLARALEHAAGLARSGKTWPGWTRSCGVDVGSTATWIVRARSAAEMPVEMPSRASIETVNAVPCGASFWSVIWRRPSSSQRSGVRQRQIRPAAVGRHEVDRVGRHELRRDRQVALVLAILVVDDDDEPARADLLDRVLDRRERARLALGGRAHAAIVAPAAVGSATDEQPLDVLREHVDLEVDRALRSERRPASSPRACAGRARRRTAPSWSSATVSDTPSTVIEPFSTQ